MVYIIRKETKDDNDACVRQWFVEYVKKQKMTTMLVLDNGLFNM